MVDENADGNPVRYFFHSTQMGGKKFMKEHPILFSAPLVRAILNGSKTQTRRVVKNTDAWHPDAHTVKIVGLGADGVAAMPHDIHGRLLGGAIKCQHGQPGERLWVREAWRTYASLDGCKPSDITPGAGIQYEALGTSICGDAGNYLLGMGKLRPSIFMPRWASRITLEITGVRVERLQDISESDALAEGITEGDDDFAGCFFCGSAMSGTTARGCYRRLWESINGAGSWDANPWVWVIEFKKTEGKPA